MKKIIFAVGKVEFFILEQVATWTYRLHLTTLLSQAIDKDINPYAFSAALKTLSKKKLIKISREYVTLTPYGRTLYGLLQKIVK